MNRLIFDIEIAKAIPSGDRIDGIDYCKNDVEITSAMLDLGLAGELIDPNTGKKLQLAELSR